MEDLSKLDQFPPEGEEVLIDPHGRHDPSKRKLAYRSPEMYLLLEKRLQIIQRENAELTKILEEHRIDPVTGEMDEDYTDALHRIETEHEERAKEIENEFMAELDALQEEREQERAVLEADKERAVAALQQQKQDAVAELRAAHAAQARKLAELQKEQQRLANTLRGTLPSLTRFLAANNFSDYESGLLREGIDSTEKLVLASTEDLQHAGLKTGHIRKLQTILKALEHATPMVVMPDGAVRAQRPQPTLETDPGQQQEQQKQGGGPSTKTKKKSSQKPARRVADWIASVDPTSGRKYLIDPHTGVTKWDEEGPLVQTPKAAAGAKPKRSRRPDTRDTDRAAEAAKLAGNVRTLFESDDEDNGDGDGDGDGTDGSDGKEPDERKVEEKASAGGTGAGAAGAAGAGADPR